MLQYLHGYVLLRTALQASGCAKRKKASAAEKAHRKRAGEVARRAYYQQVKAAAVAGGTTLGAVGLLALRADMALLGLLFVRKACAAVRRRPRARRRAALPLDALPSS